MIAKEPRNKLRKRRHLRVRKKVSGTPERPRLNVFRSSKHIYAQLIDDVAGQTLVASSTLDPQLREQLSSTGTGNKEAARLVGERIAKLAIEKGYKQVVFDRGGYPYHGRVQALAEAAREAGLDF